MTSSLRLRVVPNVSAPGATYGSGTYGDVDVTYGQRATDPADRQTYIAVPSTGEASVIVRVGDSDRSLSFNIVAFDDGDGEILDLSTVDTALLHLERVSAGTPIVKELALTVDLADDTLTRDLESDDFPAPGSYRARIALTFTSGRRLTVPPGEAPTITATEAG